MYRSIIVTIMLSMFFISGCISSMKTNLPVTPPGVLLDAMYKSTPDKWKAEMTLHLKKGKAGTLPPRHLILAVQEFNSTKTRDLCMKATFEYLMKIAETGSFTNEDQTLLQNFREYALKNPGTISLRQISRIVKFAGNASAANLR